MKLSQQVETSNGVRTDIAPDFQPVGVDAEQNTKKSIEKETLKTTIQDEPKSDPHAAGTKLGSYIFGRNLGKGTFGKVKLATHQLTKELVSTHFIYLMAKVAIKILEKARIKEKKDIERITREIKILKKVRHPNVIQLYEVSKI